MGSGAGSLCLKAKDFLIQSKYRITYKQNLQNDSTYSKKCVIEKEVRAGNIELALIHTEELMNIENDRILFAYIISYIDHLLHNIGLLNESKVSTKIHSELSSLLYSTLYITVEELEKFKGVISKKYGSAVVERALHDWDGKVTDDLLSKTKNRAVTKDEIKLRLMEISEEKKFDLCF